MVYRNAGMTKNIGRTGTTKRKGGGPPARGIPSNRSRRTARSGAIRSKVRTQPSFVVYASA